MPGGRAGGATPSASARAIWSEDPVSASIDRMLAGCQIIDHDWRYVYLNHQAAAQARRTREELVGRIFQQAWPGVEDTELFGRMKRCMEERTVERMENVFTFPDGSQGLFELSIEPVPDGILILSTEITERKEAERALRESEERYRQMTDSTADVIWVLDLETMRFAHVSPSVVRLRGFTPAEVMEQTLEDAVTAESLPRIIQLLSENLARVQQGLPVQTGTVDVDQPRKDGTIATTEVTCQFLFDGTGHPNQLLGVSRDVTERRAADRAQREAKADLEGMMSAIPDLLFRVDRQGRILWFQPPSSGEPPFPLAQTIGRLFVDLLSDDGAKVFSESLDVASRTGRHHGAICQMHLEHGSRSFELSIGAMERGTGDFIILARDVTQRLELEEQLRASEERYRFMAENMADVVWIMDPATAMMRYMSPSIERLLGYTAEELISLPPERYFTAESAQLVGPLIESLTRGEMAPILGFRLDFIHKNGRRVPVELSMRYLPGEDGRPPALVGVTHDITKRVQAERRLAEKEEQLREARTLEAVGLLAGGIAHQFNNLLATILGYTEWLQNDPSLAATDAPKYLQIIRSEGERAAGLTREMLTLSQRQVIKPSVVSLNDLVSDAEPAVREALGDKARLALALAPDAGHVAVDPHQIEELLEYLATNARDAMPEGGLVTIETANADLSEGAADAVQVAAGAYVMLSVTDTGTGMDRDTMSRLFTPFFTTKGQGKGVGLGLPVVRGIVRQSRGGISVKSEVGSGTTVRVYLPRIVASD